MACLWSFLLTSTLWNAFCALFFRWSARSRLAYLRLCWGYQALAEFCSRSRYQPVRQFSLSPRPIPPQCRQLFRTSYNGGIFWNDLSSIIDFVCHVPFCRSWCSFLVMSTTFPPSWNHVGDSLVTVALFRKFSSFSIASTICFYYAVSFKYMHTPTRILPSFAVLMNPDVFANIDDSRVCSVGRSSVSRILPSGIFRLFFKRAIPSLHDFLNSSSSCSFPSIVISYLFLGLGPRSRRPIYFAFCSGSCSLGIWKLLCLALPQR